MLNFCNRDMNSGYDGYSMSNRAVEAYENGEKPLSKWRKTDIIYAIAKIDKEKAKALKKVRLSVLKDHLLTETGWHHTSKFCNETSFYSIDEDYIEELTPEDIEALVNEKVEKTKETSDKFRGDITYYEWERRRGQHGYYKYPNDVTLKDVNIEKRGWFYYVTDDKGKLLLKKMTTSHGTRVHRYEDPTSDNTETNSTTHASSIDFDSIYYDRITKPVPNKEFIKEFLSAKREGITRAWKVYGAPGHRQRESFMPSYKYDWSENGFPRIIEELNSDVTGTNSFSIIQITRHTAEECENEFWEQLSDGVFENCRTGNVEEITGFVNDYIMSVEE